MNGKGVGDGKERGGGGGGGGGIGFLVTLLEGWVGLIWWWDEGWRW